MRWEKHTDLKSVRIFGGISCLRVSVRRGEHRYLEGWELVAALFREHRNGSSRRTDQMLRVEKGASSPFNLSWMDEGSLGLPCLQ